MYWEYTKLAVKRLDFAPGNEQSDLDSILEKYGKDRWEIVSIIPAGWHPVKKRDTQYCIIFKREKLGYVPPRTPKIQGYVDPEKFETIEKEESHA